MANHARGVTFTPHHSGNGYVDLHHRGLAHVIATAVIELDSGIALVDPGPAATVNHLTTGLAEAGYTLADITHIYLTHIHLDHAGATGTLVRDNPDLTVIVHERGAPHLEDPSRLISSASRLFGDQMDELWGTTLPVPPEALQVIPGQEPCELDGGRIVVHYTPGHASHHVTFLDHVTRIAYVGDTVGARSPAVDVILPTTPPPDISLELIESSIETILSWEPMELFITHFGPITDPVGHVTLFRQRMQSWSDHVRASLDEPGDDAARAAAFADLLRGDLRAVLSEEEIAAFEAGAPPGMSWYGLARYWRKKLEAEAT